MKKLVAVLLCVLLLTSCSGGSKDSGLENTEAKVNNNIIKLNQEISEVTDVLGDDYKVEKSKSCMFDGYDKIYTYKDMVINTYPDGEKDLVNSIIIRSKDVDIYKDIHVGDKIDDIKSAMDETPAVDDADLCTYEFEKSGITFYIEDEKICEIEIFLIQE